MSLTKVKALQKLLPTGMWDYDGVNIIISEEGKAKGVTAPTKEEIDVQIVIEEHNEPILQELRELDVKVVRSIEDLIPETDSYNYKIVLRKRELRADIK